MNTTGHIFISYARKDGLEHATRLEQALNAEGYATWRDIRMIDPAQDFTAEIEQGIEQAAWVVVCITPDVKRGDSFVRREIQYALVVKKPVLVARFGDVPPPIHVIDNTWIEFWRDWSAAERQLLSNLQKAPVEAAAPKSDDLFRPYVERLLKTSVNFLQKTVITLIDVESTASPEAVEGKAPEVDMLAQLFEAHELKDETAEKREFKTFAEAFEHYHGRVLLLGEPGAGKTITLMATTREAATRRLDDPTQPLPLFGLIPTWDAYKRPPLMDWLVGAISELKGSEAAKHLRDEDVLFLLDGLDELPESRPIDPEKPQGETFNPRIRFLEVVERSSAKIVVSCRIEDYKSIRQKAALDGAITLKRLTDEQVRAYLRDLPLLWKVISEDKDLLDIAKTPLLLSIIAFAFQKQPENLQQLADLKEGALRDAIFMAYIRERYEHERRKLKQRGLVPPFELERLILDLGWIAMVNAAGGDYYVKENVISKRDFWRVLGADKSPVFISLCERLNLILKVELDLSWRFIHLKLRDALVSSRAEKLISDPALTVRFLALDGLKGINDNRGVLELIRRLSNAGVNFSRSTTGIRARIRSDLDGLETLLHDPQEEVRASAQAVMASSQPYNMETHVEIKIPSKVDRERLARMLLLRLGNSNSAIRSGAAEILLSIWGGRVVKVLVSLLYNPDNLVRTGAAETLGRTNDVQVVNELLRLLDDEYWNVRLAAANALGKIGDGRAVERLLSTLDDEDADVRKNVVHSLSAIGNEKALRAVDEYRKTCPPDSVWY